MVKFEQETTNNWNTVNQAMGLEYTSLSTPKPIESDIGVILAITGDQELSFSSDVLFNVQGGMIISVDGPNISRRHSSSVISSSFTRNSYSYFHYHPNELCWEVDSWVVHCVQEYLVSSTSRWDRYNASGYSFQREIANEQAIFWRSYCLFISELLFIPSKKSCSKLLQSLLRIYK